MAQHFNLQDKVVTGGSFIPVSTTRVSARQKLKDVAFALGSADNTELIRYLESILGDNIVTPDEKVTLASRWRQTAESYGRLRESIREAYGSEELSQLDDINSLYSSLLEQVEEILADMTTPSTVSAAFESMYAEFSSRFSDISLTYARSIYEITRYSIVLGADSGSYSDGESVTITVQLKKDDEEITGVDFADYGIVWRIAGADINLNDPSYRYIESDGGEIKKQGVRFPASSFTGSVTVDCYMSIPTGSSSPS